MQTSVVPGRLRKYIPILGWLPGNSREWLRFDVLAGLTAAAVGSEAFVAATKEKLGFKAKGREVIEVNGSYELRESPAPYKDILGHENPVLRPQNAYFWEDQSDPMPLMPRMFFNVEQAVEAYLGMSGK